MDSLRSCFASVVILKTYETEVINLGVASLFYCNMLEKMKTLLKIFC